MDNGRVVAKAEVQVANGAVAKDGTVMEILKVDVGNDGSVIGWIVECNVGRKRNRMGSCGSDSDPVSFGECEL